MSPGGRTQLQIAYSRFSPLIDENLEGATKPDEKLVTSRSGGDLSRLRGKGYALHPLGKLVYHDQHILVSLLSPGEWSYEVNIIINM